MDLCVYVHAQVGVLFISALYSVSVILWACELYADLETYVRSESFHYILCFFHSSDQINGVITSLHVFNFPACMKPPLLPGHKLVSLLF